MRTLNHTYCRVQGEKGLIHDPRNKNKSIILTEEGLTLARSAMIEFFAKEQ